MSCCGQKRMAFKQELENSSRYEAENSAGFQPEAEKKPRIFEYTGDEHLILRGISSGAAYHFRFKGEKLEVNYYDSFAMMAERDLKIVL
ncbi:MAG TPA: hypothetical protein VK892_18135 [Pyrinomonadaceae bacterium]|nr:hypothetical protein [Pyrinomonadaceae bacterium]